jgi:hypothetical protein
VIDSVALRLLWPALWISAKKRQSLLKETSPEKCHFPGK